MDICQTQVAAFIGCGYDLLRDNIKPRNIFDFSGVDDLDFNVGTTVSPTAVGLLVIFIELSQKNDAAA